MLETTEIQDKAGRVIATVTTCDHEGDTVPVITSDGVHVADLCTTCDRQLPTVYTTRWTP